MSDNSPSTLGMLWRGALMGLAEVVPGVSGGTMALVTGIYRILVEGLASFGAKSLSLLASPKDFYTHHNLAQLLPLAAGMGIGIAIFAQVIGYLIDNFPPVVWAFFFGVILASVVRVGSDALANGPAGLTILIAVLGVVLSLGLYLIPQLDSAPTLWVFFFAGALAICAWILPAVSGSYLLLVLGLYEPVIDAIRNFDLLLIMVFGGGCAVGLMLFVRLLQKLLANHYHQLLSLLTGFMLGSVMNLWPWRVSSEARFASPEEYLAMTGFDPFLLPVGISLLLGVAFLWLISSYRV